MSNSFARFWLRPLIQKQYSRTVYHISLHSAYIQHLLNLRHPYYIMIRRSSYLTIRNQQQKNNYNDFKKMPIKSIFESRKNHPHCSNALSTKTQKIDREINEIGYLNHLVIFVPWRTAIKAKCIAIAVQAIHITLASGRITVNPADIEKRCVQQWFKPWRHRHCVLLKTNPWKSTFILYKTN